VVGSARVMEKGYNSGKNMKVVGDTAASSHIWGVPPFYYINI